VAEALKHAGSDLVCIQFGQSNLDPILIEDGTYTSIVMPLRLL
jgi:hypothetical protein